MKRIDVREVSNSPGRQWSAHLRDSNGTGVGYYGSTADEALGKLRANHDCDGIEPTYHKSVLIPIAEHPWITGQTKVEYTDGSHGHIDTSGILNDCDIDQVNVLLQQEDRVSVAISSFAANTGALILLLVIGMMLAFSLGTPDPRVTGWMSNDAPVMTEVSQ